MATLASQQSSQIVNILYNNDCGVLEANPAWTYRIYQQEASPVETLAGGSMVYVAPYSASQGRQS
jgi:hypothetical protein